MGVISGVILSQLVYNFFLAHSGDDASTRALPAAIAQPTLALLGGYSVDFVHGVLKRAINAVGNFFGGSMDGGADNRQRTAIAEALAQERLATASELAELKRALSGNPDPEEVRKRLDGLIQRISLKLPRHQTDANWGCFRVRRKQASNQATTLRLLKQNQLGGGWT
jgi:hypothetical protein